MESLAKMDGDPSASIIMISFIAILLGFAEPAMSDSSKLKTWDTGKKIPMLIFENIKGEEFSIDTFTGNVMVINFWATWCAPCVKEMPSLIRLAESFQKAPFKLILVNFGESPGKVTSFSETLPDTSDIYLDKKKLSNDSWVTRGLPVTYILDKKGNIKFQVLGELSWDSSEVKKVIGELIR